MLFIPSHLFEFFIDKFNVVMSRFPSTLQLKSSQNSNRQLESELANVKDVCSRQKDQVCCSYFVLNVCCKKDEL